MIVKAQAFAMKMAERWQDSMGVVTPELIHVWEQQAETLNAKIDGEYNGRWIVLHPPTGSGKSRGLETYCSMLPLDEHPGVLIVVRMKDDADGMVEAINNEVGDTVAIARYTDSGVELDDLADYPVAIITHSAYQIALEAPIVREKITSWKGGKRKLTVIDESLNIVEQTQVSMDQLRELRGIIPDWMREQNLVECAMLDKVLAKMDAIVESSKSRARAIPVNEWALPDYLSFSGLSRGIGNLKLDEIILNKADESERDNLQRKYQTLLSDLPNVILQECWYAKKGKFHLFTKARVTVPAQYMDAVVLDATAACNPIYGLLGDRVILIAPPENVRTYANVTLHVSHGHKVGKLSMTKNAGETASAFMGDLKTVLPPERKALICTHKDVEPHILGYSEFPDYEVCHFGAIDGKNNWQDAGSAVMYGLQYLDQIVPETTLRAIEEWQGITFSADKREGMLHRLAVDHQIVLLVQAMNRVRCRRVIDENGNCDTTDIFILLPDKLRTSEILTGILSEMPAIKIVPWRAKAPKRKVKRSNYEPALVAYLKTKLRGSHKAQDIRRELGIPETSFNRLLAKAGNTATELCRELQTIGVKFCVHDNGQGGRGFYSWFEKFV